ncbi:hypothetical protein B0H14DRAFT_3705911 [Mycena olivaceomarginata]|nr:hypothetical protein B0H14DRAFT_3705911 [Mycena olivaceomarginata]
MWPLLSFLGPQSRTILLLLLLPAFVEGAIINTTVDDTETSFNWSESWTAVTPSRPCAGCASKPDASKVEGGSWHDGNIMTTKDDSAGGSLTFQGSAVYIYGIDQADSEADILFTLDSITSTHHYTGSDRFAYHALFFSATGLAADQTHTVKWTLAKNSASDRDLQTTLFDYAVVTSGTADTTTTASDSSNGGSGSNTTTAGNSCGLLYIRLGRNLTTQQNCHVLRIIFLCWKIKIIRPIPSADRDSSWQLQYRSAGRFFFRQGWGRFESVWRRSLKTQRRSHHWCRSRDTSGRSVRHRASAGKPLSPHMRLRRATRGGVDAESTLSTRSSPSRPHAISPPPPPHRAPRSEKTLESPAPKRVGKATASLVRNATQRSRTFDVAQSPVSVSSSASASITARERMLEERLAELEAHIGNAPPPYVTE